MRIKIDYKASKQVDGQITDTPIPGVIVTEIPENKFNDRAFVEETLRKETEDPDAEMVSYEQE
ncbi:hypothetical protein [Alkalicoccus luteus]|uniref:hypothetical protein n=1 Tax=Alkalicoccus luteus TaxID=1237094 RepID=UPI0040341E1B